GDLGAGEPEVTPAQFSLLIPEPVAEVVPPQTPTPFSLQRWVGAAVIIILVGGIATIWLKRAQPAASTAASPATAVASASVSNALPTKEVRILGGWAKGPYTDPFGQIWLTDRYVTGGYVMNYAGHIVDGAPDPKLFETSREGDFQYDIPLDPGTYELRLHFAEMMFGGRNVGAGGEGSRIFDVDVNGKRLLSRFDILSDAAGANLADERVFKDISPDSDGMLRMSFKHMIRDPLLNALEIKPSLPGRMNPVRILTSEQPFMDQAGNRWQADRYYRGGQLIARPHPVSGTNDPGLYRHARCGNLTYVIPVAPDSKYSVTLRFAEGWIGTGNPVGGGVGSRLFNIFCNAQTLARNFDIYKEAGGAERAVERTFRGLQPDPQGKLVLHLQPVEGYACINAIEVLDEGK
ncbi:MAG TPA: malectin domain-containing carbohydrate-binding protein, partial [Blastocatellia bacterium]|nr:malectin domain-containing carbohydrate-binding protein [Blastocatellia bacterium]